MTPHVAEWHRYWDRRDAAWFRSICQAALTDTSVSDKSEAEAQ